jgi:hypothetical protein
MHLPVPLSLLGKNKKKTATEKLCVQQQHCALLQ